MTATDLTTLANLKAYLRLSSTSDDAMLERLITAVSTYIQSWLNRSFASQTYAERRDGAGRPYLLFSNYPVTAVSSVTVDGQAIPASTGFGVPGYAFDETTLWLTGYTFAKGMKNVTIGYTAGFSSVPPEIEQACIETAALRYKEIDRLGHASKTIQGETVAFNITDFLPATRTILGNYKKVIPNA